MQSNRPTLAASIIAKNEAEVIGDCLDSLRPWCDEMIVLDTGSTDETVEIAFQHGAVVYRSEHFEAGTPWQDFDFSAARNEAMSKCQSDWCLTIDCDEVWHPFIDVRDWLIGKPRVLHLVRLNTNIGIFSGPRLVPNDGTLRWCYRCHEVPRPDTGMQLVPEGVAEINHKRGSNRRESLDRNMELLRRDLLELWVEGKEALPVIKTLFDIGRTYKELGHRLEALGYLFMAFQYQKDPPFIRSPMYHATCQLIAMIFRDLRLLPAAYQFAQLAWRTPAKLMDAGTILAECLIEMGRHRRALEVLEELQFCAPGPNGTKTPGQFAEFREWLQRKTAEAMAALEEHGCQVCGDSRRIPITASADRTRPCPACNSTREVVPC